ncbi:DNA/RNA non-specific endonuclease, partial [Candidatus Thiosymbion oneisti]|uniref:DNA/RNA non-specific endonuclease n=1 Tax=Candidatus Thiosymbion oneisti TaxID=589554 RepID=UPI0034E0B810
MGLNNQVGPAAYKRNPWDRGHLTRRTAVTWGSKYEAKRASNDSCSYANASMQHENFNQDEWRVPERIVQHLEKDKNGRITIFTGPVFTQTDRWYPRRTLQQKV